MTPAQRGAIFSEAVDLFELSDGLTDLINSDIEAGDITKTEIRKLTRDVRFIKKEAKSLLKQIIHEK